MGLLGNILSGAVSDGLGKAVGKAVEKAVAPAAERWAGKQADALDKLADAQAKAVDAAAQNIDSAAKDLDAAAQEGAAQEAAKPAMTPEQAEQAKQAADALKGFGMLFSGAVAKAKEEAAREEAEKKAREAAVFDNWQENLPAYPVWDVGGSEFEMEEQTPMNGHPVYSLRLKGRPYLVELYAAKLRAAGFIAKGCSNPQDLNADTYYKLVDGVCYAWNRSDACCDGWISVSFFVDIYKPAPQKQATPASDLKQVAKGLFKKLF